MSQKTYDFDTLEISGSWATNNPIIGTVALFQARIADEYFTDTRANADYENEVDGHGNVIRNRNHNETGSFQIVVSKISPVIATLTKANKLDKEGARVVGSFTFNDPNSGSEVVYQGAYLSGQPISISAGRLRGNYLYTFNYTKRNADLKGHEAII